MTVRQVAVAVACRGTGDNRGTVLVVQKSKQILKIQQIILHLSSACDLSYLLTLGRPARGGPLPGGHPHVVAAFGQSKRLVYSITRNGRVQVVAKETAGGGSHLLCRGVTMPPVFVAVVSNRRTGPVSRENAMKHTLTHTLATLFQKKWKHKLKLGVLIVGRILRVYFILQ